jgi:hypothetical protein
MSTHPPVPMESPASAGSLQGDRTRRWLPFLCGVVLLWAGVAYLIMPALWTRYAEEHPSLEDIPGITYTGSGIPGDPLNVALLGSKAEVMRAMVQAKWYAADPLTMSSCLEIAEASVLKRPYDAAPVSNLFLFGRKEDLAFEMPVGNDPRQRHHVRFWPLAKPSSTGRSIWVGSATYDRQVGLSHTTLEFTHHIDADVDVERDHLVAGLEAAGALEKSYVVDGFHDVASGKNGEGDPWRTDGSLRVAVIRAGLR